MYLFPLLWVLSSTLLYFGAPEEGAEKKITLENRLKNFIDEA